MTLTGDQILRGFSEFTGDFEASTTTSAGNSGATTLIDTYMGRYGDGHLVGQFIRLTSGTYTLQIRRITNNTQATGTITVSPAFGGQVASGVTYQLHRYDPDKKFLALDKARYDVLDHVYRLVYDDTLTSDGLSDAYDIPSTLDNGPVLAISETPLPIKPDWNFLSDPQGDSLTNWTASSTTATIHTKSSNDLLIPKYDYSCTKLVTAATTAATYSQVVGSMTNSITAALAADRKMTLAAWVFCTETSKIQLRLLDDSGTVATGDFHQGRGWELLWVEGTVAGNNATTLTARFVIASTANASTIYWERAWLYFGSKERVVDSIYGPEHSIDIRRDEATQHVILSSIPPRGRQIRLVGKTLLTSLGTTPATQITNTMEVTSGTAEILYARAAEILFQWERVNTDNQAEVAQRIQMVKERQPKLVESWAQETPRVRLKSPFSY